MLILGKKRLKINELEESRVEGKEGIKREEKPHQKLRAYGRGKDESIN